MTSLITRLFSLSSPWLFCVLMTFGFSSANPQGRYTDIKLLFGTNETPWSLRDWKEYVGDSVGETTKGEVLYANDLNHSGGIVITGVFNFKQVPPMYGRIYEANFLAGLNNPSALYFKIDPIMLQSSASRKIHVLLGRKEPKAVYISTVDVGLNDFQNYDPLKTPIEYQHSFTKFRPFGAHRQDYPEHLDPKTIDQVGFLIEPSFDRQTQKYSNAFYLKIFELGVYYDRSREVQDDGGLEAN